MTNKLIALAVMIGVVSAAMNHLMDNTIAMAIAWAMVIYALGPMRIVRGILGLLVLVFSMVACL